MSFATPQAGQSSGPRLQVRRYPLAVRVDAQRLARRAVYALTGFVLPVLLLALWQHAVDRTWLPHQILPAPLLVMHSFVESWTSGDLPAAIEISLSRLAWSGLIGGSVGLLLGVLMGTSRRVSAYLLPTFEVVSQFPVIGWIPILIIFLGIDEPLKIAAISIAIVTPVTINTQRGIANVPGTLHEVGRVLGFQPHQTIYRLVLPAARASIFNGLRQGVMQGWLSLVFVELLASSEGLGYMMVWGRQLMQLDLVVIAMIVIGVIGAALDLALHRIEIQLARGTRTAF
jgi:sulfonate transport system permease protein